QRRQDDEVKPQIPAPVDTRRLVQLARDRAQIACDHERTEAQARRQQDVADLGVIQVQMQYQLELRDQAAGQEEREHEEGVPKATPLDVAPRDGEGDQERTEHADDGRGHGIEDGIAEKVREVSAHPGVAEVGQVEALGDTGRVEEERLRRLQRDVDQIEQRKDVHEGDHEQ